MPSQRPLEHWDAGPAYDQYVGRWSRKVASVFVEWLAVAPGKRWLDIGCGTGALSLAIAEHASPRLLIGLDTSNDYMSLARQRVANVTRSFFVTADVRVLPLRDVAFDAAVSGLALNFVPGSDQRAAVVAMRRAVQPGGVVAAYVWDYAGRMQFMRYFWDAVAALDPVLSARAWAIRGYRRD